MEGGRLLVNMAGSVSPETGAAPILHLRYGMVQEGWLFPMVRFDDNPSPTFEVSLR